MARDENPPFRRGQTFYNGETIDTNNLGGVNLEGKEYVFEDDIRETGLPVRCKVVRNVGAAALLPKRLVSYKAGYYGRRVDGYTDVTAEAGYPVDELLPAAGVAVNDLFYIVVEGPALVLTDIAAGANGVINEGEPLSALTAVTSGATTAGRAYAPLAGITGVTTAPDNLNANVFGRAMSANTTANTNNSLLAYIKATF